LEAGMLFFRPRAPARCIAVFGSPSPFSGQHDLIADCATGSVGAVSSARGVLADVPDCAVWGTLGVQGGAIHTREESGDDFVSKLKLVNFSAEKILWQHDAPGQIWAFSSPQLPICHKAVIFQLPQAIRKGTAKPVRLGRHSRSAFMSGTHKSLIVTFVMC